MPRLFVVVPFWNCEGLLQRCFESLEQQSHAATVVLVDDASDAPARDLARAWSERAEGRVLLVRPENAGPAAARHAGLSWVLEHAQSDADVVVLLDGDDALAHDRVLATLAAVYENDGRVAMTLGGHRRASGKPIYRRRYRRFHLSLGLVRAAPWRARQPRSFRVGLLRSVWSELRWRWPNGAWLRSGTDVLLILPMLDRLRWSELVQLEEVLYVYNDVRPDGSTIESSAKGRWLQLCAEAYVRRSLGWMLVTLPRVVLIAAKQQLLARSSGLARRRRSMRG